MIPYNSLLVEQVFHLKEIIEESKLLSRTMDYIDDQNH
jgi:hypothetical protein